MEFSILVLDILKWRMEFSLLVLDILKCGMEFSIWGFGILKCGMEFPLLGLDISWMVLKFHPMVCGGFLSSVALKSSALSLEKKQYPQPSHSLRLAQ